MSEINPEQQRPTPLLTKGNASLNGMKGKYKWTIPALFAVIDDVKVVTCPSAGVCGDGCYALAGSYRFSNVLGRHQQNLRFVLEDLAGWEQAMTRELTAKRYQGARVRIHDAGDFFSDAYTEAWVRIMRASPETNFYCYTKEVARFRRLVEPNKPSNFDFAYSYGGKHDRSLNPAVDRVADVFPDEEAIVAADGWESQAGDDARVVTNQSLKVGMSANNIPHLLKRIDGRRFSEWQAEVDARKETESAVRRAERETGAGSPGE